MANYWPAFWSDLQSAIEAAWPEFQSENAVIFRATQAASINWQNLVEQFQQAGSGGIQLPYCVAQIGPAVADETWEINNSVKRIDTTIYFIADKRNQSNVAASVEAKVYTLANRFETVRYAGFQCIDECTTDVTEINPANSVFLGQDLPLFAGSVSAPLLVGECDG